MSGPEDAERRAEAARWLAVADQDAAAAHACLDARLPGVAAYHCQQAVEKIAKALIVAGGRSFPKTHDLATLNGLAAALYPELGAALAELEPITVWGFAYRYPPEEEEAAPPAPDAVRARLVPIESLRRAADAVVVATGARTSGGA